MIQGTIYGSIILVLIMAHIYILRHATASLSMSCSPAPSPCFYDLGLGFRVYDLGLRARSPAGSKYPIIG